MTARAAPTVITASDMARTDRDMVDETSPGPLLLRHVRIVMDRRRREVLLNRPRADPANQIQLRPRLVVRARRARATERLLPDDGACWFVVDVEVARRVLERARRLANRLPVARKDR